MGDRVGLWFRDLWIDCQFFVFGTAVFGRMAYGIVLPKKPELAWPDRRIGDGGER